MHAGYAGYAGYLACDLVHGWQSPAACANASLHHWGFEGEREPEAAPLYAAVSSGVDGQFGDDQGRVLARGAGGRPSPLGEVLDGEQPRQVRATRGRAEQLGEV